jgi:drug/metabolite transporter (DMT)-like permease
MATMMLWGFNFVALKVILVQMTPQAAALVRFVIMYAFLIMICRWRGISLRYPERRDTLWILFQGFLSMGVYMVFFTLGMRDSTAAEGAIILGTSPIFTILIAVAVRQEKFHLESLLGILAAFAGVALVVYFGDHPPARTGGMSPKMFGNLLVFAGAAVWAWSTVISKPLVGRHDPLRLLTLSMPGALLALIPFGLHDVIRLDWSELSFTTWSMMIYFSGLAGTLGFVLFYEGVRQVGASGAMVYQYFVSPIAVLFAFLVLGQGLHLMQLIGLVVVLSGVAYTNHTRGKR